MALDDATTLADLLARIQTGIPENVTAQTMRSLVNTLFRNATKQLTVTFTGAGALIPDFVDTPGDETGELVVNFGTGSNNDLNIVAGEVEVLNAGTKAITNVTLSFTKTGGGGSHTIKAWLETSLDAGATWNTVLNSARDFEIASDGQGTNEIIFSEDQLTPDGARFRMKISDITGGTGSINIAKPVDVVGLRGTISGFAAKATFTYHLEEAIAVP